MTRMLKGAMKAAVRSFAGAPGDKTRFWKPDTPEKMSGWVKLMYQQQQGEFEKLAALVNPEKLPFPPPDDAAAIKAWSSAYKTATEKAGLPTPWETLDGIMQLEKTRAGGLRVPYYEALKVYAAKSDNKPLEKFLEALIVKCKALEAGKAPLKLDAKVPELDSFKADATKLGIWPGSDASNADLFTDTALKAREEAADLEGATDFVQGVHKAFADKVVEQAMGKPEMAAAAIAFFKDAKLPVPAALTAALTTSDAAAAPDAEQLATMHGMMKVFSELGVEPPPTFTIKS